jgi:hypothetical protein
MAERRTIMQWSAATRILTSEEPMNLNDALTAHRAWKTKLNTYIAKPDGSLKPADVEPDNRCELGKWIHGDGSAHRALPEFSTLTTTHAVFHKAAADVIRRANTGKDLTAEVEIGASSDFGNASSAVVLAIYKMQELKLA